MKQVLCVWIFVATVAMAQQFEVASVKIAGPQSERGSAGGPGSSDPNRYRYHGAHLDDFIAIAYDVDYFQISSPAPLDKKTFDLDAKLPDGATKAQFRVMMQNLLRERFHLKSHMVSKEFSGYEMVVAKNGPKLGTAANRAPIDGFPELPPGRPGMMSKHTPSGNYILIRIQARQEPLSVLAEGLQVPNDGPVVDKTGLPGRYDFTLEYTQDRRGANPEGASEPPPAPNVFTALQQQLGLQLVEKKVMLPAVVVESVDLVPVEN